VYNFFFAVYHCDFFSSSLKWSYLWGNINGQGYELADRSDGKMFIVRCFLHPSPVRGRGTGESSWQ